MRKGFVLKLTLSMLLASPALKVQASSAHKHVLQLHEFNLPKQELSRSLEAFVQITDINFLIDEDIIKEQTSHPLQGRFTAQAAIDVLLCQSGLSAEFHKSNVLIIKKTEDYNEKSGNKKDEDCLKFLVSGISEQPPEPSNANLNSPVESTFYDEDYIERISILGTRGPSRTVNRSPVPIDVFNSEEILQFGNTADLTDNLKSLVPSFLATPATGDGSAFIRPTSLRGMSPDQTLVMVNGKRRHRSALVQFLAPAASNGAHGSDIGMIPSIGLKRIEILRDGASAQYGSDAISGVINLQLKDHTDDNLVRLQYGEFFDGEHSWTVGASVSKELGENGFINVSVESNDNEALSRGIQRPDAQALVDSGIPDVGMDSPFGDQPLVQSWGRPETSGTKMVFNSGWQIGNWMDFYLHGGAANTHGRYRFFYRPPNHESLNSVTSLPAGYTPYLDGEQQDFNVVAGVKGETGQNTNFDISVSIGRNTLDYFLNNTINPGLVDSTTGLPGQRDFNMGGYEQQEINVNADLIYNMSETMAIAFGMEWREESYRTKAGELNAFGILPGPNGLTSVTESDAGKFRRENIALYVDFEQNVTDKLLLQYALRYENYSDFGDTNNVKLALLYKVSETLTFRSSASTGFHAPTPGQANFTTSITTFDGASGNQVEEGLVKPEHPDAVISGGATLKEEQSKNISFGLAKNVNENINLTLDFYNISVDGRIYRTTDIEAPSGNTISFYTNALNLEHQGMEIVLTARHNLTTNLDGLLSFAYSKNRVDIVGQELINGVSPVSDATIEDIENNYPEDRFVATANFEFAERWELMIRANFYGEHFVERGRINDITNPTARINSILYWDLELTYDILPELSLTIGGQNVFDRYVDEIGTEFANRLNVGLQYPRRTPANYEGGSWYLTINYGF